MKDPANTKPTQTATVWRAVGLALLACASQPGCGREFYREWANQDVSEAIYEKSRDPRFRIDLFSVEPPAMARHADPYDPDRPPAPPDDFASQALSPVPQWPDHRLITPVEGTGYLALIEKDSRRYQAPPPKPANPSTETPPAVPTTPPPEGSTSPFSPRGEDFTPTNPPQPTQPGTRTSPPIPPALPGPEASRTNSGTKPAGMSPNSPSARPAQTAARTPTPGVRKDDGLRRTAAQDSPQPMPAQTPNPAPGPPVNPVVGTPPPGRDPLQPVPTPMDPNQSDSRLDVPINPRPDLKPEQYRESE